MASNTNCLTTTIRLTPRGLREVTKRTCENSIGEEVEEEEEEERERERERERGREREKKMERYRN